LWGLVALAGLTVSLHLLYHFDYQTHSIFARSPISDAKAYHETACRLAKGVPGAGSQLTGLTIGYPLLVSAIYRRAGCRFEAARLVQLVVGIGLVGALVALAWIVFGPAEGILSGLLLVLYGPLLFYETKLLPAVWAAFVVVVGLLALEFARRTSVIMAWVAGLCLGLAALLRPNLILLPLFLLGGWGIQRHRDRGGRRQQGTTAIPARSWSSLLAGMMGLAMGLVPAPMVLKGAVGQWHLFPATGGVTLLAGNHDGAAGVYEPPQGFKGDKAGQVAQTAQLASRLDPDERPTRDPYRDSRTLTRHVLHWIIQHPGSWVWLEGLKMYRFMLAAEPRSAYSFRFERRHVPSLYLAFVPWSFLVVFGLLGLVVTWHRRELLALRSVVAVVWVTTLVFFVSSRYRVVAAPPLALFSSVGLFWLVRRSKGKSAIPLTAGLFLAVAVLSVDPFDQPRRLEAVDAFNRALAHRRLGDPKGALAILDRAVALSNGAAVYQVEKGNTLVAMGRTGQAYRIYEQVLQRHPRSVEAWANLAVLEWRAGRLSKAFDFLNHAVALRPHDAMLRLHLARLALRLGRLETAKRWAASVRKGQADPEMRHRAEILLRILARKKRQAHRDGSETIRQAGPMDVGGRQSGAR